MSKSGYVAIIGRPNAGKSTLLNAILGTQISIVTPKAQTTREQIQGILTEKRGQIIFIDTPGIHRAREGGLNEYMVNQAKEALEAPNLIWYLVDPHSSLEHEKTVIEILTNVKKTPVFLLMNKSDTLKKERLEAHAETLQKQLEEKLKEVGISVLKSEMISAVIQSGPKKVILDKLLEDTWNFIPEGPLYYPDPDQVSDRPMKFFVAEKVREQLFRCLGEEVPYSCAVEVTSFKEDSKPVRIEAIIHVERESQKGIVIGQNGKKIKEIGQEARAEIEKFIGEKIFLGLKVELSRNWTEQSKDLKRMGYK
jgi:GTP-binding protein Era